MVGRLTLIFVLICCVLKPVFAQDDELKNALVLPGFGYLPYDNSFWSGGWWDNPYAPTLKNMDESYRIRLQSGDTLETPLTVETVGTDPMDALAALNLELITRPGWITLGKEDESTIKALIVEAKVGDEERLMEQETNRLLVLVLPPHENNWYLITIDNVVSMWPLNKPAIYSDIKSFHYVPNAPLLRVVLAYDVPEGELTRQHELKALDVISRRLHILELETPFSVHLLPDHTVEVGFYGAVTDVAELADWLRQTGFFEIVDFSDIDDPDSYQDKLIQTTGREDWIEASQISSAQISPDSELNPVTSAPFESVITSLTMTNAQMWMKPPATQWRMEIMVSDEVEDAVDQFGREHKGEAMAVVLDGKVLYTPYFQKAISFQREVYTKYASSEKVVLFQGFEEEVLRRFEAIIDSGPLPVPMTVQTIELLE